ncbi:hypothetical protein FC831_13790 [Clostridium botulinum]|nr:hypothetical protein [Clostridium botulinum]
MGYDCSITNRKGCNYCIRGKAIPFVLNDEDWTIDDERKVLESTEDMIYKQIKINYCPICGKKL